MRIVDAGYEILDPLNGEEILKKIERVARVCYKSEDKITEGSAEKMVRALIKSNHMAMLEHYSFSVKFICDRGVSHEIVRHRVASYAQESTRYCNYNKSGDVAFIRPVFFEEDTPEMDNWVDSCMRAEKTYNYLISEGRTPQEARSVLPNSLKTEVVMTANLREWRHFLSLRACGSTGKPHPQMLEVAVPLLKELKDRVPVVFDDLEPMEWVTGYSIEKGTATVKLCDTGLEITVSLDDIESTGSTQPHRAFNSEVHILGTRYSIRIIDEDDYRYDREADGWCDPSVKEILIFNYKQSAESVKDLVAYQKKVLRHEIVHAFLYESGLWQNAYGSKCWAKNEEMIDWMAIQIPKIQKAYKEAYCDE